MARVGSLEVRDDTVVYEDAELGQAMDELTDDSVDRPWRFVFLSQLSFSPPLSPGIGSLAVSPIVVREAFRAFAEDLRARGIGDVHRDAAQRMRSDDGRNLMVERFTGSLAHSDDDQTGVEIEGWVGVGRHGGEFRVVGGAYPTQGLPDDVSGDPNEYRRELLSLIRLVS